MVYKPWSEYNPNSEKIGAKKQHIPTYVYTQYQYVIKAQMSRDLTIVNSLRQSLE